MIETGRGGCSSRFLTLEDGESEDMDQAKSLNEFFSAIANDPRIGVSHISLFCALLNNSIKTGEDKISIITPQLMNSAKISGLATYHKCIRDLHEFGYIRYQPSYNHRKKSKVYLIM